MDQKQKQKNKDKKRYVRKQKQEEHVRHVETVLSKLLFVTAFAVLFCCVGLVSGLVNGLVNGSSFVWADDTENTFVAGDYKYRVISEENKTVSFSGYSDEFLENYKNADPGANTDLHLVIPQTVVPAAGGDQYTVTELDDYLFYSWNTRTKEPSQGIVSVTIPATVTVIGEEAFAYCQKLSTLTIADGSALKEIKDEAFYYTGITRLDLPDSVEVIGDWTFRECPFESVNISTESSLKEIGDRAFYGSGKFEYIFLPATLETLGREAFSGCCYYSSGHYVTGLKTVVIANGCKLKSISDEAFRGCYFLENINIPEGVEVIGKEAFSECKKLQQITFPSTIKEIGNEAFWLCYDEKSGTGLTSVIMAAGPEGGIAIGEQAFDQCEKLQRCDPAEFAVSFGEEAFWRTDLRTLHIREGVTEIPEDCFYLNESLEELTLPNGLLTIGEDAFSNCISLKSVTLPETLTTIDSTAFYACDSLESFHVPASVTYIEPGRGPVGSCASMTRITVDPANTVYDSRDNCNCIIRTADNAVICGCQTSVIPASAEIIEEYTFSGTKGLKVLTFGPGKSKLREVKHAAFFCNDDIEEAVFPEGVIFTGSMHFQQCGALKKVKIPWGVEEFVGSAFYLCNSLTDLTLPSSFSKMEWNPLSNCGVRIVNYEGNEDTWAAVEMDDRSVHWRDQVQYVSGHIPVDDAVITLSKTSCAYTGSAIKPSVSAVYKGLKMKQGRDYTVRYENNTKVGTAVVKITGIGSFTGTAKFEFKITKAANPLKITAKTATVKYKTLKKKAQSLAVTKVITFTKKGQGKMTYTLSSAKKGSKSFKKYFAISKTTGKVTVKKGLKKGTYKVKVKVKAAGNTNYKPSAVKTVIFKVKVR